MSHIVVCRAVLYDHKLCFRIGRVRINVVQQGPVFLEQVSYDRNADFCIELIKLSVFAKLDKPNVFTCALPIRPLRNITRSSCFLIIGVSSSVAIHYKWNSSHDLL